MTWELLPDWRTSWDSGPPSPHASENNKRKKDWNINQLPDLYITKIKPIRTRLHLSNWETW